MKFRSPRFVVMSLASVTVLGVLATGPANAAPSECKGLDQAACASAAGCGWINGYTRKDGKTVAGYCKRGKGSKDAAAPAAAQAPAATPPVKMPPPKPVVKPAAPYGAGTGTATGTAPYGTATGTAPK